MDAPREAEPIIHVWADAFGDIVLPDDFPTTALTVSGWFDRRYKICSDVRRYIAEQSRKLETGAEESGFRAPGFVEWRRAVHGGEQVAA